MIHLIGCLESWCCLPKDIVTASTLVYVCKNKLERRTPLAGKLKVKSVLKKPVSHICLPRAFAIVAAGNPVNFIVVLLVPAAVVVILANRLDRHAVLENIAQTLQIVFYYFVDLLAWLVVDTEDATAMTTDYATGSTTSTASSSTSTDTTGDFLVPETITYDMQK